MPRLTINLVGDPPVLVQSLATALDSWALGAEQPWVVTAGTRRRSLVPDVVVVVDLTDRVPAGLGQVRDAHPDAAVVWIAGDPNGRSVAEAVASGCACVVTQRCRIEEVARGVEQAAAGQSWTSPELVGPLLDHLRNGPQEVEDQPSVRELEVLALLASGASTQAIADQLFISMHTTRNHIRRLMAKLGAHSRVEAVAIGRARRLIPPD